MDDIVSGAGYLRDIRAPKSVNRILMNRGMLVHKWCSKAPELYQTHDKIYPFGNSEESKEVVVLWKSKKDCSSFNVKNHNKVNVTKKQVLSVIWRIFDPLKLVAPIIIKPKTFMHKLWLLQLNCADSLSEKAAME